MTRAITRPLASAVGILGEIERGNYNSPVSVSSRTEIAAASREQSSGIEQVNTAITQMDQTTQQNAALVEEASAASQAMAQRARQLNETIARYRTSGGAAGSEFAGQVQAHAVNVVERVRADRALHAVR